MAGADGLTGRPDADRDRDGLGRPRSARPRDAAGRPLPRGAPGANGTDAEIADAPALPPAQALDLAQQLLEQGRPFAAHEVLEAVWKASPEPERDLWRGLAQLAVGLTHLQRGNVRGAAALLRRGADRLSPFATAAGPAHGIPVESLQAAALRIADAAAAGRIQPGETIALPLCGGSSSR